MEDHYYTIGDAESAVENIQRVFDALKQADTLYRDDIEKKLQMEFCFIQVACDTLYIKIKKFLTTDKEEE